MVLDVIAMENMEEWIFDDGLFVSYKFISVRFGIHVNQAKQVMYEFYDKQKIRGKDIFATYYISGLAPQRWIASIASKTSKSSAELPPNPEEPLALEFDPEDDYYDQDGYLVLLCQEHELEEYKKKFSELLSLHVYGLSKFPMNDFGRLSDYMQQPIMDDEGNSIIKYGAILMEGGEELYVDPRYAPALQNIDEVKARTLADKDKYEEQQRIKEEAKSKPKTTHDMFKSTTAKKDKDKKDTATTATATTTKKGASGSGGGKDRLKNMFASAASKPSTKSSRKEVVVTSDDSQDCEMIEKKSAPSKNKTPPKSKYKGSSSKKKAVVEQSKKRKRIRDVFSSSEDDSDAEQNKMSEDEEEEGLPESPIPRKRIQIESDSDDDFKPSVTPKKSAPTSPPPSNKGGKRRVSKTVPNRSVDEEGYLVTVMEQVMVSESDDEGFLAEVEAVEVEPPFETKKKDAPDPPPPSKKGKTSTVAKPSKPSAAPPAKTKQASIMSFFSKK